jgi:prepilin-type N-terminal cleavage/methylation domain-containing protein
MRSRRGFTLVEVLVAATVLGIALLSGTWTMSTTTSASSVYAADPLTASLVAREIHALAQALPKTPSGSPGVTSGGAVVALDSLIGASFSPPIKADRSADTSLVGWTQQVGLTVYDLSDLSTPTRDDPTVGLSSDASKVYKLSVTVLENGSVADTFSWWISP